MKIAVVCSNGRVGRLVVEELVNRGQDVTGFAKSKNKSKVTYFIKKDLFDLTEEDLKGFDVVIDAFGVWVENSFELHITSLNHLSNLLSNKNTRLIIIGGAASLYTNSEHKQMLIDTPDFPDEFRPVASNMVKALENLRKRNDVKWTYISPAADFQAEGIRTGKYKLGGEEIILNSKGKSEISYADFAIAVAQEAVNAKNIQKRISVVSN